MVLRITSGVVALIIVLGVAATVFRIYTAPDRIQQRLDTAKTVCEKSGGKWVVDSKGYDPVCEKP